MECGFHGMRGLMGCAVPCAKISCAKLPATARQPVAESARAPRAVRRRAGKALRRANRQALLERGATRSAASSRDAAPIECSGVSSTGCSNPSGETGPIRGNRAYPGKPGPSEHADVPGFAAEMWGETRWIVWRTGRGHASPLPQLSRCAGGAIRAPVASPPIGASRWPVPAWRGPVSSWQVPVPACCARRPSRCPKSSKRSPIQPCTGLRPRFLRGPGCGAGRPLEAAHWPSVGRTRPGHPSKPSQTGFSRPEPSQRAEYPPLSLGVTLCCI